MQNLTSVEIDQVAGAGAQPSMNASAALEALAARKGLDAAYINSLVEHIKKERDAMMAEVVRKFS